MHKSILSFFVTAITITALLMAVGCGDDEECPTCPTDIDTVTVSETITDTLSDTLTDTLEVPQEFLAWSSGYIYLDPEFCLDAYIFANGGANPYIDSITVGDSLLLDIDASYYWNESDPYFYLYECEDGDDLQYVSGDVAVVTMYGSGLSSTCSLVLLDYEDDEAEITVPDDNDTTVLYNGTGFECFWTNIPNAEWYGVELNYYVDSVGTTVSRYIYTYTYDTSYTVADSIDGYPVEYVYLYALPTTGPDPESGFGNWTGDFTAGKLYSTSDYAWADVYFNNPSTLAKPAIVDRAEKPKKSPQEIIEAIYKAYE